MHQSVPGLWEKDENEEESEDADGAVDEEGGGGGGELVDVLEGLGHHEPPQVGRRVRHRVRPPLRSALQMFCRELLLRQVCRRSGWWKTVTRSLESRQSAFIPDWQHLGGHGPREAAHPHVERGSEQHLQMRGVFDSSCIQYVYSEFNFQLRHTRRY